MNSSTWQKHKVWGVWVNISLGACDLIVHGEVLVHVQTVKHLRGDHSKNHGLGMNGEKPSWSQYSSRHIFFHDHTIANHTIDSSIHPQVAKSEWAVGCIWPALNEKSSLQKSTRVPKMIIRLYIQIYIYMCMFIDFFQLHFESKKPVWKQKVPISSPLCGNLPIKNRPGIWSSHPNGHKSPCRNRSRPITPAGPSWARLQWPCTGPWPNEQPSPWWCWDMIVTRWNTKKTVHFYSKGCLVFNSWFFWRPFYIKLCW